MPTVSVCILTHNRARDVLECIDSVAELDYPKGCMEILVFDDASTDETPRLVRQRLDGLTGERYRRLQYIRSEKNVQVAAGRNRLFRETDPESQLVLFLDDDCVMEPGLLRTLVEAMSRDSSIGAVGPRIVEHANPSNVVHSASYIHPWTGRYREDRAESEVECDWLNATTILVRREVLERGALFDEGLFRHHEDADFCLEIKKRGFRIVYVPEACSRHKIDPRMPLKREMLDYFYRNKFLLIRRHFKGVKKLSALAVHLLLGVPRYFLESIRYHRGVDRGELRRILGAVRDGLFRPK